MKMLLIAVAMALIGGYYAITYIIGNFGFFGLFAFGFALMSILIAVIITQVVVAKYG